MGDSPAEWGEKIEGGYYSDENHVYRDEQGRVVISSTQVFAILNMFDFSMVATDVMAWKSNYGLAIHKATELLVFDQLDWDTVDDAIIPAVAGIEQYLGSIQFEPLATEEMKIVTVNGMKYGMRLDLRGTIMYRGRRVSVVIDLKTGSAFSPTWPWQLGSYALGSPRPPEGVYQGLILQSSKVGKVTPHYADIAKSQREFIVLLAAANLKLNAGLAKL